MVFTILQVALGGAIGSALRFGAGAGVARLTGPGFPWAVLGVNVFGSFVMGCVFVYFAARGLGHWQPFVMTGILGGFTTFSAFSLETFTLFEGGAAGAALLYVLASVILSVLGLAAGVMLARGVLP